MRIRIIALSGALAASTLLAAPAMADETTPPADPTAVRQAPAPAKFRNTCNPADRGPARQRRGRPDW